jgi:ribosomal protein L12E/L44/L45/RPP1/RPP2
VDVGGAPAGDCVAAGEDRGGLCTDPGKGASDDDDDDDDDDEEEEEDDDEDEDEDNDGMMMITGGREPSLAPKE